MYIHYKSRFRVLYIQYHSQTRGQYRRAIRFKISKTELNYNNTNKKADLDGRLSGMLRAQPLNRQNVSYEDFLVRHVMV